MNTQMFENEDLFEFWIMDMDTALDKFFSVLPEGTKQRLDYSPESLQILEAWLLCQYSDTSLMLPVSESKLVDGIARYIGEVFRKNLGGKWIIDFKDKKNAFFGLPQLSGMPGQKQQICPLTLATASADRRTGMFLQTVYQNNKRHVDNAKGIWS